MFNLYIALMGRLPWKRLPGYWMAQYLGAFVSSAVVFGVYYGNIICMCVCIYNDIIGVGTGDARGAIYSTPTI